MSRRSTTQTAEVSLFPFLAVLLCTMGSLIVVLVVLAQQASKRAPVVAQEALDAWQRLQDEYDAIQQRIALMIREREQRAAEYQIAQQTLDRLTADSDQLRDELNAARERVAQKNAAHGNADDDKLAQLRDQLLWNQRKLTELEDALIRSRQRASQQRESFAILPHVGPNATQRRPLYIECRADVVILQPEGIELTAKDFEGDGPSGPLVAALRTATQYWREKGLGEAASQPYPLVLVRPEGVASYYVVLDVLSSWGSDFGYEFIDDEMNLAFPPPDPQLALLQARAIDSSRELQSRFVRSTRRRGGRPSFRVSPSGGLVRVDGGSGSGGGSYEGGGDGAGSGSGSFARQAGLESQVGSAAAHGVQHGGASGGLGGSMAPGGSRSGVAGESRLNGGAAGGLPGSLAGGMGGGDSREALPGAAAGGPRFPVSDNAFNSALGGGSSRTPGGGRAGGNAGSDRVFSPELSTAAGLNQNGGGDNSLNGGDPIYAGPRGAGYSAAAASSGAHGSNGAGSAGGAPGGTQDAGSLTSTGGASTGGAASGGVAANSRASQQGHGSSSGAGGQAGGASGDSGGGAFGGAGAPSQGMDERRPEFRDDLPDQSPGAITYNVASVASQRGADWALPQSNVNGVRIARSIRLLVDADALSILDDDPRRPPHKTIRLGPRTAAHIDELRSAIWEEMNAWGSAGRSMYWKPVLHVNVTERGWQRYQELKILLRDSGVGLQDPREK